MVGEVAAHGPGRHDGVGDGTIHHRIVHAGHGHGLSRAPVAARERERRRCHRALGEVGAGEPDRHVGRRLRVQPNRERGGTAGLRGHEPGSRRHRDPERDHDAIRAEFRGVVPRVRRGPRHALPGDQAPSRDVDRASEVATAVGGEESKVGPAFTERGSVVVGLEDLHTRIREEHLARSGADVARHAQGRPREHGGCEDRRVHQEIRLAGRFGAIVRGRAVAIQIDSEARVGEDGIAAQRVSCSASCLDADTIAEIEGDRVRLACRSSADAVVGPASPNHQHARAAVRDRGRSRDVGADPVPLDDVGRAARADPVVEIPRDQVAFVGQGSADLSPTALRQDPAVRRAAHAIADGGGSTHVRADVVALDDGARDAGVDVDPLVVVARRDVPVGSRRASDHRVGGADRDAVDPIAPVERPGRIQPEPIPRDQGARAVHLDATRREAVDDEPAHRDTRPRQQQAVHTAAGPCAIQLDDRCAAPARLRLRTEDHRRGDRRKRGSGADRRYAADEEVVGCSQAGCRRTIADHEDGILDAGGPAALGKRRVTTQGIGVGEQLPKAPLPAVVRIDDRVEVETEVHARDIAGDDAHRSERMSLSGPGSGESARRRGQDPPGRGVALVCRARIVPTYVIGDVGGRSRGGIGPKRLDWSKAGHIARPRRADAARHDSHRIGTRRQAREGVVAARVGVRRADERARAVEQLHPGIRPPHAGCGHSVAPRAAAVLDVLEDRARQAEGPCSRRG